MVQTGGAEVTADIAREVGAWVAGVGAGVRVGGRDVRRGESRVGGGRGHGLWWGRHHLVHLAQVVHLVHLVHLAHLRHLIKLVELVHLLQRGVMLRGVEEAGLGGSSGGSGSGSMLLVPSARVGVVVYPRVARQLVGATEALGAARELAGVRLLARVGADVSGLVLEAVEGLVAQRALVGARQVGTMVLVLLLHCVGHGGDSGSGGGHGRIGLHAGVDVRGGCMGAGRDGRGRRRVGGRWIQQIGKSDSGRCALH